MPLLRSSATHSLTDRNKQRLAACGKAQRPIFNSTIAKIVIYEVNLGHESTHSRQQKFSHLCKLTASRFSDKALGQAGPNYTCTGLHCHLIITEPGWSGHQKDMVFFKPSYPMFHKTEALPLSSVSAGVLLR